MYLWPYLGCSKVLSTKNLYHMENFNRLEMHLNRLVVSLSNRFFEKITFEKGFKNHACHRHCIFKCFLITYFTNVPKQEQIHSNSTETLVVCLIPSSESPYLTKTCF